jgi:hypothetical protein
VHRIGHLIVCGLALLLGACTSGGADGAAAQTPLATLERALTGPGPFEAVRALDPAGLKWLGVADLRATGPDTRAFVVDALVFDWPIPVRGRLRQTDGAWAVESLEPASSWRGRARLAGDPDGAHLPEARSARPTAIGLTGRDTALRPSSAVVVAVWGDAPSDGLPSGLEVDGTPAEPATWTTALASARALREAVASEQHATATAQVAFAVPTTLPMNLLDRLRQGALEAGYEDHFLLVRRPNGGPGVLSLGRAVPAVAGQALPVIDLAASDGALALTLGPYSARLPEGTERVDEVQLGRALEAVRVDTTTVAGLHLAPVAWKNVGQMVLLLDALRAVAPELPVWVEPGPVVGP